MATDGSSADAYLQSSNYSAPTTDSHYSQAGTKIDVEAGTITSKHFAIESNGDAWFDGTIYANKITGSTTKGGLTLNFTDGTISATGFSIDSSGNATYSGNLKVLDNQSHLIFGAFNTAEGSWSAHTAYIGPLTASADLLTYQGTETGYGTFVIGKHYIGVATGTPTGSKDDPYLWKFTHNGNLFTEGSIILTNNYNKTFGINAANTNATLTWDNNGKLIFRYIGELAFATEGHYLPSLTYTSDTYYGLLKFGRSVTDNNHLYSALFQSALVEDTTYIVTNINNLPAGKVEGQLGFVIID